MAKKFYYLLIIVLAINVCSCKKGDESFMTSRPTHENNFKTALKGELYAYTAKDTASVRADYFMKVRGYIMNYGESKIIQYGHCWVKGDGTPKIGTDSLMSKITEGMPEVGDSLQFESNMQNLEENTKYSIASYVIVEKDGEQVVAYNKPDTIRTKPALDEWFEQYAGSKHGNYQPQNSRRFDALGFSFGDTLFYGTGADGKGSLKNLLRMYVPSGDKENMGEWEDLHPLPKHILGDPYFDNSLTLSPNGGFSDGIGFAIEYKAFGMVRRSIFVGFGDHKGDDVNLSKSNFLMEYNITPNYSGPPAWEVYKSSLNRRSGAVCFVLGDLAYIGTGANSSDLAETNYNWRVFVPQEAVERKSNGFHEVDPPTYIKRKGAVSFVLNGKGYFGLGIDESGNFLKDFWCFTPATDKATARDGGGSWEKVADFPGKGRQNAVAFVIGDFAYVGSGDNLKPSTGDKAWFMQEKDKSTGTVFNDFYRFNRFTQNWRKVHIRNYTTDKTKREKAIRPITRAVAFSLQKKKVGFVGYGLVPPGYCDTIENYKKYPPHETTNTPAQQDFWMYKPFDE